MVKEVHNPNSAYGFQRAQELGQNPIKTSAQTDEPWFSVLFRALCQDYGDDGRWTRANTQEITEREFDLIWKHLTQNGVDATEIQSLQRYVQTHTNAINKLDANQAKWDAITDPMKLHFESDNWVWQNTAKWRQQKLLAEWKDISGVTPPNPSIRRNFVTLKYAAVDLLNKATHAQQCLEQFLELAINTNTDIHSTEHDAPQVFEPITKAPLPLTEKPNTGRFTQPIKIPKSHQKFAQKTKTKEKVASRFKNNQMMRKLAEYLLLHDGSLQFALQQLELKLKDEHSTITFEALLCNEWSDAEIQTLINFLYRKESRIEQAGIKVILSNDKVQQRLFDIASKMTPKTAQPPSATDYLTHFLMH